ncbi:MAG: bifunctional folylpolyglutamate synthase/dihydrofolate synthase [Terriglobales bacterium]
MNSSESLQYLHALGAELHPGRKFTLATIARLLDALDNPQRAFASVHIAGTNGKGSTAALIAAAARAAGYRTGLYTSPHLQRVNERIRIAGEDIAPPDLAGAATSVRDAVEQLLAADELPHPPAFFEVMTAIGFLALAHAGVELAVVEVGLGGRLDATNVLAPLLAAITPVGLDHEAFLGPDIASIAGEKAGIIKPGVHAVVVAPQVPEAMAVIAARAQATNVPLLAIAAADAASAPATALRGEHQRVNAAVAAAVCRQLGACGFPVPEAAIATGFASVHWPGRLELICDHPQVFLDGAHNPMAARALGAFLDTYAHTHPAPVLLFGCMRDKALEEICEVLFPRAAAVVLTAPAHPRALAPAALAEAYGPLAPRWEIAAAYPQALAAARRISGAAGHPIFITGSLYLVGEAREYGCGPS